MHNFFALFDINLLNVLLGTLFLSTSSAMVGTFAFLRKSTLKSDAIAHAVLPGICLAFFLTERKNSPWLVVGAFTTGWLASVAMHKITQLSKIKQDTAVAVVASVSFGLGNFLLSILQHSSYAHQGGLKSFLLGSAATLLKEDVCFLLILNGVVFVGLCLFFKELTTMAFDPSFAKSIGIPVQKMEYVFTTLLVLVIVMSIRAVGVVLMSAMLITPPVAAKFWIVSVKNMILLSSLIAFFSAVCGTYVSYLLPYMPTGPWIVFVMSVLAYLSFSVYFLRHRIKKCDA